LETSLHPPILRTCKAEQLRATVCIPTSVILLQSSSCRTLRLRQWPAKAMTAASRMRWQPVKLSSSRSGHRDAICSTPAEERRSQNETSKLVRSGQLFATVSMPTSEISHLDRLSRSIDSEASFANSRKRGRLTSFRTTSRRAKIFALRCSGMSLSPFGGRNWSLFETHSQQMSTKGSGSKTVSCIIRGKRSKE